MKRFAGLIALASMLAPAGAHGAPRTVSANFDNAFSPRVTAVAPGEAVTFVNRGGLHNVDWEDSFPSQPRSPAEGWTVARTLTRPGPYRYFCSVHGSRGGLGMAGVVYVTASGAVPPPGFAGASAVGTERRTSLRLNASEPSRLDVTLYLGSALVRRTVRRVPGGPSTRVVTGLAPGRYRIVLRLVAGGRRSALRTLFATVR